MKKVIVIVGQTATGKSYLAVRIAKKLSAKGGPASSWNGAEIISADSRQVYKGLDLGTGKITKKEMQGVPHHLLDVTNPKTRFTVARYKKLADRKIKEIIARGKVPIICGGTGFYIDAITKGIILPKVPPNIKLRAKYTQKSAMALFKVLKKLDEDRAKNIDPHNKVRLIRAIEIAKTLGKVPPIIQTIPVYKFIKIGLKVPEEQLKRKIQKRLLTRIKMGMLSEARKLRKRGLSWRRMRELGLEYGFIAIYLQNKIDKVEMLKKLNTEIYKYAKRQMTWFKRDKEIKWFDLSKLKQRQALKLLVKKIQGL